MRLGILLAFKIYKKYFISFQNLQEVYQISKMATSTSLLCWILIFNWLKLNLYPILWQVAWSNKCLHFIFISFSFECVPKIFFSYFSTKTYVVGTQKKSLNETGFFEHQKYVKTDG